MSKIAVSPNGSGTGTYTLASPNNNASHTITLPVATGELLVNTATGVDVTGTVTMDGGSTSGDFTFGDNDKATFGNSSDLQLYHDGSSSYISDQGEGSLKLLASSFYLNNAADTENIIVASQNGAVSLFYNNIAKIGTSSNGATVSGTMTATAFAGDGSALTGVGPSTTTGAVGTYAWLGRNSGSSTLSAGSTYAGSGLRYAGAGQYSWAGGNTAYSTSRGGAPAGTWRAMGTCTSSYSTVSPSTIFVRIS